MKEDMNKNLQIVIKVIMKYGDDWYKEINIIIEMFKYNFNEKSFIQLDVISIQEDDIRCIIFVIIECIFDMKKLFDF